jgi:hypothetical protein
MRSFISWWKRPLSRTATNGLYGELAFRDLMHREFTRSEKSGHSCYILFVYRTDSEGAIVSMGTNIMNVSARVLSRTLRDTDYIGWYQESSILAALLTTVKSDSGGESIRGLKARVVAALRHNVPVGAHYPIQVCLCGKDQLHAFQGAFFSPASIK